jgi:hypothetical protein
MANIQDPENRGTMIFAWWMTCICDAYASAYYRRKPVLDDDDYDIDFYTAEPVADSSDALANAPSPREQLEVSSLRLIQRFTVSHTWILCAAQFLVGSQGGRNSSTDINFSHRDIIAPPIHLLGPPVTCHVSSGVPPLILTASLSKRCAHLFLHCRTGGSNT